MFFPSLAAQKTYVAETNVFASDQKKNFSLTQILLPRHMLPSLATMEAMLTSLCACVTLCSQNIVPSFSHPDSKTFSLLPANLAT